MSQKDHHKVKYLSYQNVPCIVLYVGPSPANKVFGQIQGSWLNLFPLAGLQFFAGVIPCNALVQDIITCVTTLCKEKLRECLCVAVVFLE